MSVPAAPIASPPVEVQPVAQPQPTTVSYTAEPAIVAPTVTVPSSAAAMSAPPMVGIAAAAVVAPPMPDPYVDPPVARSPRHAETMRIEAHPGQRVSHVVSLNEQIAAHAQTVEPQQQWVEVRSEPRPPAAADLVANIQERLLPDPSLFELPIDAPAVTPHHGYR